MITCLTLMRSANTNVIVVHTFCFTSNKQCSNPNKNYNGKSKQNNHRTKSIIACTMLYAKIYSIYVIVSNTLPLGTCKPACHHQMQKKSPILI